MPTLSLALTPHRPRPSPYIQDPVGPASPSRTRRGAGTEMYMAPEVQGGGVSTPASDVYAFAISCLKLFLPDSPLLLDAMTGVAIIPE